MPFTPVESVHYLFDRYAWLGVPETASHSEIEAAIRQKRVENHPDRLIHAGPEVQATAKAILETLQKCVDVLLDPELRAQFDIKFEAFRKERPQAITKRDTVLYDMNSMLFDVSVLLGADGDDGSELLVQAEQLSGYNPKTVEKLRKLLQADPDDTDVQDMLREALEAEFTYLEFLEDDTWKHAGVLGKKDKMRGRLTHAEDYAAQVGVEVERVLAEDIPQQIGEVVYAARLGMSTPLLVLPGPRHDTVEPLNRQALARLDVVEVYSKLLEEAKAVWAKRAERIRATAERKQAVMVELAALAPLIWLSPKPHVAGPYVVYLLAQLKDDKEPRAVMAFAAYDFSLKVQALEEDPYVGMPLSELRCQSFPGEAMAVEMNSEMKHPLLVVSPACERRRRALGVPVPTE